MPNVADLREFIRGDRRHSRTDLGLERAGHECVGQVELDDYATRILEKRWPDVPKIRDVRDFTGTEFGPFDLLTGGYPCQPFSLAGSRKGESDDRHLWPEVHRIIRNVRPRYVLLENVPGHLTLGFGRVLGDLAEGGYDAEWDCIPASSVGAPHQRDRVFILAYPQEHRRAIGGTGYERRDPHPQTGKQLRCELGRGGSASGTVAHASSFGWDARRAGHSTEEQGGRQLDRGGSRPRQLADTDREQMVGTPIAWSERNPWPAEPNVGRVANGVPHRVDRLRTLGNAVVPQVAEWIGRNLQRALKGGEA